MKTKNIILTLALLLSLYIPTQAQSNEGGFWDGIEGSLNNMFTNPIQGTEAGRLFMLFNSDISMIMKAHNDKEIHSFGLPILGFQTTSGPSDASMTAEFDWDNKALSMHLKESASDETTSWVAPVIGIGGDKKTNEASDQYQYTDKDGYWYVPYNGGFVKFNAKRVARDVATGLSEADLKSLTEEMVLEFNKIFNLIFQNSVSTWGMSLGYLMMGIDSKIRTGVQNAQSKANEISKVLNSAYMEIVGFPVFIHWALLYSPDYIRARHSVRETTVAYHGIPGCIKLTVASGKEKGKYMVFDQYNRLVYIDSKKDGSVQFFYGRDLTVRLPAAKTMDEVMDDAIKSSRK